MQEKPIYGNTDEIISDKLKSKCAKVLTKSSLNLLISKLVEQKTFRQISKETGVNHVTLFVRYKQAINKLKRHFNCE